MQYHFIPYVMPFTTHVIAFTTHVMPFTTHVKSFTPYVMPFTTHVKSFITLCNVIYHPCKIIYPLCNVIYHPCKIIYTLCNAIYHPCKIIYTLCNAIYHPCNAISAQVTAPQPHIHPLIHHHPKQKKRAKSPFPIYNQVLLSFKSNLAPHIQAVVLRQHPTHVKQHACPNVSVPVRIAGSYFHQVKTNNLLAAFA